MTSVSPSSPVRRFPVPIVCTLLALALPGAVSASHRDRILVDPAEPTSMDALEVEIEATCCSAPARILETTLEIEDGVVRVVADRRCGPLSTVWGYEQTVTIPPLPPGEHLIEYHTTGTCSSDGPRVAEEVTVRPAVFGEPFLVADIDTTGEPCEVDCPGVGSPPTRPLLGGLPEQLTAWGGVGLVFAANDRTHGFEPWISDGTPAGTRMLADLLPGEHASAPMILGEAGGDFLLWARSEGVDSCRLWRVDRQTLAVTPLGAGPQGCGHRPLPPATPFEGSLLFEVARPGPSGGIVLFRSDGTPGGTSEVLEICGSHEPCTSGTGRYAYLDGVQYLASLRDLWAWLHPSAPPTVSHELPCAHELTPALVDPFRGFFFVAGRGPRGVYLRDHSGSSTEVLALLAEFGIGPTETPLVPAHLTVRGDALYFAVAETAHAGEARLWKSDGTPEGTLPVTPPFVSADFAPSGLALVDGRLIFGAVPEGGGDETLFHALDEGDGLHLLRDGPAFPAEILSLGRRALVSLATSELGLELWTTDGTAAGTRLLADLEPGLGGSRPMELTRLGDLVFFAAERGDEGRELWAVPLVEGSEPEVPEPPYGTWIASPEAPGFRFQARITADEAREGAAEPDCQPDTVCVSGALPGRSELFLRVLGPRPNGFFWPTVVRFTPSRVEVWIERTATGELRYYELGAVPPGTDDLPGVQDRTGFPVE